ncbi:MAG: DUF4160 domain-containing protein [Blastochloris sp.]|nr:DUF4160 domain-containing protein [Blastochloris sp.]
MATVAYLSGVRIVFYQNEHPPPHFHAIGGAGRVRVEIATSKVLDGHMERDKLQAVLSWSRMRKAALMAAWDACRHDEDPGRIE